MEDDPRRCFPFTVIPKCLHRRHRRRSTDLLYRVRAPGLRPHRRFQSDEARSAADLNDSDLRPLRSHRRVRLREIIQTAQRKELGMECRPYGICVSYSTGRRVCLGEHSSMES